MRPHALLGVLAALAACEPAADTDVESIPVCEPFAVPASLDFGAVEVGSPVTLDLPIGNAGDAGCTVTGAGRREQRPGRHRSTTASNSPARRRLIPERR